MRDKLTREGFTRSVHELSGIAQAKDELEAAAVLLALVAALDSGNETSLYEHIDIWMQALRKTVEAHV